jgi:translation initiation factor 3 subunit G
MKFGLERGNARGVDERTTSIGDDVPFYLGPDWREEETREQFEVRGSLKSVICRICQGEHFTMKCNQSTLMSTTTATTEITDTRVVSDEKKRYVPPGLRARKETPTTTTLSESTCLRISDLSRQITDQEFISRFSQFGKITRSFLARDYKTGELRGYGYITFLRRESAVKAIKIMDRKGYDNLIMRVAWDERPRYTAEKLGKVGKI